MNKILKRFMTLGALIALILIISPLKVFAENQDAYFAGGCFWCLEHDLENIPGVLSVESGYSGGDKLNPTYRDHDGHQEAVKIIFDSSKINYNKLLRIFWRNIDPIDKEGQFCDRGNSYKAVIFVKDESQHNMAISSKKYASNELSQSLENIGVNILEFKRFWLAEDYHQNYADNNTYKYNFYRYSCGRDARLDEVWGSRARSDLPWGSNQN